MGEISDMMISGVMCEMCGTCLECDECEDMGIPMYCSIGCAKDRGASKDQVCNHETKEPADFDFREMAELIIGYGYTLVEMDVKQKRVRFKGEKRKDIIDLWNGKRGITMSIRDIKTGKMKYKKWCTLDGIENMIVDKLKQT